MDKLLRVIIVLLAAPVFIVLLAGALSSLGGVGPLELSIIVIPTYAVGLWWALKTRPYPAAK